MALASPIATGRTAEVLAWVKSEVVCKLAFPVDAEIQAGWSIGASSMSRAC